MRKRRLSFLSTRRRRRPRPSLTVTLIGYWTELVCEFFHCLEAKAESEKLKLLASKVDYLLMNSSFSRK